jgi:hypothetical protein
MATTRIPAGTKVMFEKDGKIREGVVEASHGGNTLSTAVSYTIIYRRGQWTVPAGDVAEF